MGKLNDSLLSGSTGRTGRLVVANVAGTEILRVRPKKRTSGPSPKQLLIQDRMKQCYAFILPYKGFASLYFGTKQGMRSCYNQAITNLLNAYKLDFNLLTITPEYSVIQFARGSLLAAIPTGLSSPSAGSFTVEWYNNAAGDPDRETDQLQLLYVAEGEKSPLFIENMGERRDTTLTVNIPPNLQGKMIHVWITFRSQDMIQVSLSSYFGSVMVS